MLLSADKKFLFVHIQKTGGSSIGTVLRERVPDVRHFLGTHDFAVKAWDALGDGWGSYFSAAFVRNPWERMVSWYEMIRQQGKKNAEGLSSLKFWHYVLERASTFEEFLYECTDTIEDRDGCKSILFNQIDYIADSSGAVMVDFVGRFERLEQDAQGLFERLGLGQVSLPQVNRSDHGSYRVYYSEETRGLVEERFARDIAYFGYEF